MNKTIFPPFKSYILLIKILEKIMANLLYVDNSNIWIEGQHIAALQSGKVGSIWDAVNHNITEKWNLDFGCLIAIAGGEKSEIKIAKLFGSRPPTNDSLWNAAEKQGFKVIVFDRNKANKEKRIDIELSQNIRDDIDYHDGGVFAPGDVITLVSGDADYIPLVERIRKKNIQIDIVFWDHASKDLKAAASNFINLTPYWKHLTSSKS